MNYRLAAPAAVLAVLVLAGCGKEAKTPVTADKVIEELQRPALILAPNKILAAQLYGEFKSFFPIKAVE